MTVSASPGEYRYTAAAVGPESTGETVCGFFIVADAAQIVKVEMTELDVSCGDGGLVAVSDEQRSVKTFLPGLGNGRLKYCAIGGAI